MTKVGRRLLHKTTASCDFWCSGVLTSAAAAAQPLHLQPISVLRPWMQLFCWLCLVCFEYRTGND